MTQRTIPENKSKIEAAFWVFHREHPEVYAELVRIARRLRDQGWQKFGIATIFEVTRYHGALGRLGGSGPKLNNNYRSYYARLIMEREPDLRGFFSTRKLGVPSHIVPA